MGRTGQSDADERGEVEELRARRGGELRCVRRCADVYNKRCVLRAGNRAWCGAMPMSETCLSVIH